MTHHVKYVGPHEAVEIPALGISAERGQTIEVDEGAALALTAQADWEAAKAPRKSDPKPDREVN